MDLLIYYPLIWILSVLIGLVIGESRGRLISGLAWSVVLGPVGVLLVAALPNRKQAAEEKARHAQLVELHTQMLAELRALRQPEPPIYEQAAPLYQEQPAQVYEEAQG